LKQLLSRCGEELDASASVRLIEIPVFGRYGMFDRIPEDTLPAEFARSIETASAREYGTAFDAFIDRLAEWRAKDQKGLMSWIGRRMERLRSRLKVDGADGAASRIADAFCVCYAAACLARTFGVLPWSRRLIARAVKKCHTEHRKLFEAQRGASDPLHLVRKYIIDHMKRFYDVRGQPSRLNDREFNSAAGFITADKNGRKELCFSSAMFGRSFAVHTSLRAVVQRLRDAGVLRADVDKSVTKRTIRAGGHRDRVYCISADILKPKFVHSHPGIAVCVEGWQVKRHWPIQNNLSGKANRLTSWPVA
jgi:hypothetical protein